MPQSKLNGVNACNEGRQWDADVDKYLSGFCSETTLALLNKAMKIMKPTPRSFLDWMALKQTDRLSISRFYNVLFRSFLGAGMLEDAIEVLQEMKKAEIRINFKSFYYLASVHVKAQRIREAEEILDLIKAFGHKQHPGVHRLLFHEYLRADDEEGVERLLKRCEKVEDFNIAFKAYAKFGKDEAVLKLLERMEAVGVDANANTIYQVIQCLCSAERLDDALKLVAKHKEKFFTVPNILVHSLIEKKRSAEALELVIQMKSHGCELTIETHNMLISEYLNMGETEKALTQLKEMKAAGYAPTSETLSLLKENLEKVGLQYLEADGQVGDEGNHEKIELEYGEVDSQIKRVEKDTDTEVATRILAICEQKSWGADVEDALSGLSSELTNKAVKKVLEKVHQNNLKGFFQWARNQNDYVHGRHAYKALIRRFLDAGEVDSAMDYIQEMREKEIKTLPNDYAQVVYHCGKSGNLEKAIEAVEVMKSSGIKPNEQVYGALVSGLLEAHDDKGVESVLQSFLDVGQFNSAISAFVKVGNLDSAMRVLDIMKEKNCSSNLQTYYLSVRGLCDAGKTETALQLCQNMHGEGLLPDLKIYNALMDHLCWHNKLEEALKLFSEMKENGCAPDVVTHNSLIAGYLRAKQTAKAYEHMELMKAEGCSPTHATRRLFVVNLDTKGGLDNAVQVFQKAVENGENLSIDVCKCLLKGLIKAGKLREALKIFEGLKVVDRDAYVIMLRGCCNLSKFDAIEQLLAEARENRIQLPTATYVVLLQTYSRAKMFKKVASLFKELKESSGSLNGPRTTTAILDALNRAHQLDAAVDFCGHLIDNNEKVNSRQLKYFFRLLIKAGRTSEATEMRKNMTDKGLVVPEKSETQAA
ncbi:hypothetical protein KP509_23G015500 [Ceratopteris richardii]|nr:hypothetical protein KP509_23G015500 [Ceratopteris richardii]